MPTAAARSVPHTRLSKPSGGRQGGAPGGGPEHQGQHCRRKDREAHHHRGHPEPQRAQRGPDVAGPQDGGCGEHQGGGGGGGICIGGAGGSGRGSWSRRVGPKQGRCSVGAAQVQRQAPGPGKQGQPPGPQRPGSWCLRSDGCRVYSGGLGGDPGAGGQCADPETESQVRQCQAVGKPTKPQTQPHLRSGCRRPAGTPTRLS